MSATVGRGTFVHGAPAHASSGVIDLTVNQLLATPFGGELIAAASTIDPDLLASLLEYQPHHGHERHRRIMARWAGLRGVPATVDEIVVTAGAQHSLLAALATLTRPGEAVLTEAVTYTGLISVANHLHLRLVPVPVDAGGLDVDAFARAAKRSGARVAYLMPTLQNPTGVTLAAGRRKALLQAAVKYDITLIEDDEYGVFSSTLPLAADAPDRCLYLTGVSKSVAPGLRVGLLRAPASLVPRLGAAVFASSVMAPPFGTELVGRWLADGLAERVIAWKRAEFQARTTLARQILGPGGLGLRDVSPISPHLWLPTGAARRRRVPRTGAAARRHRQRRPELRRRGRPGAAVRARLSRPAVDARGAGAGARRAARRARPAADAARRDRLTARCAQPARRERHPGRGVDRGEIREEARIGLGHAGRVLDGDAAGGRAEDREAHRDAVVVVAMDHRRRHRRRLDRQPVVAVRHPLSELAAARSPWRPVDPFP